MATISPVAVSASTALPSAVTPTNVAGKPLSSRTISSGAGFPSSTTTVVVVVEVGGTKVDVASANEVVTWADGEVDGAIEDVPFPAGSTGSAPPHAAETSSSRPMAAVRVFMTRPNVLRGAINPCTVCEETR